MPVQAFLTIREAAAMTGRSEKWIRDNLRDGKLQGVKDDSDGRHTWLIAKRDLEKWNTRAYLPRGRAGGPSPRARYVVSIPKSDEAEKQLIAVVTALPNATLRAGRGKLLVDTYFVDDEGDGDATSPVNA
jgi:excisionase family DNA binding protein